MNVHYRPINVGDFDSIETEVGGQQRTSKSSSRDRASVPCWRSITATWARCTYVNMTLVSRTREA